MNIEQLRQFETIARSGTLTAAAEELHITQPALSRSMVRLEADLGVELFERKGKSIALNRRGKAALEYIRSILHEEHLMRIVLNDMAQKANALLIATVAPAPLWRLTGFIVEHVPEQLLTSRFERQQDVERDILNGNADLGISLKPVHYPSIECCHLMDERLSIAVPAGHRLGERNSLKPEDLEGETFLMYENVGFWAESVQKALPRSNFVIQEDHAVFEQLVTQGSALSFVSDAPYQRHRIDGYVRIPFDDTSASASFYLLARTDGSFSARDIFARIRECHAEIR